MRCNCMHTTDRSDRWPTGAIATQLAIQLRDACDTDIFTVLSKRAVVDRRCGDAARDIDSQCRYCSSTKTFRVNFGI